MSTAETSGDMALASHMEAVKDGFIATGPTTIHVFTRESRRVSLDRFASCATVCWRRRGRRRWQTT